MAEADAGKTGSRGRRPDVVGIAPQVIGQGAPSRGKVLVAGGDKAGGMADVRGAGPVGAPALLRIGQALDRISLAGRRVQGCFP